MRLARRGQCAGLLGREPRSRRVVPSGAAAKAQGDAATPTRDKLKSDASSFASPLSARVETRGCALSQRRERPGRASEGHCRSLGG